MEQFVNRFVKILYILIINDLSDKFYYLREHKGGSIPPFFIIDRLCRYRTRPQIVIYVGRVCRVR